VKIGALPFSNEGLKFFFFDRIFSRAVRVRDRVFAPLRYADTGHTKYTVLARSLAYDLFIMRTLTHNFQKIYHKPTDTFCFIALTKSYTKY